MRLLSILWSRRGLSSSRASFFSFQAAKNGPFIAPSLASVFFCLALAACTAKEPLGTSAVIRVGTIAGPETELMELVKDLAKEEQGLEIKLIPFNDFMTPNLALADGSLEANIYQHLPYLQEAIAMRGFDFTAVGQTFIYPLAAYSHKISDLSKLAQGAKVAIPNDPSNEGRALLLLEEAGLVTLKEGRGLKPSVQDIKANPKQLQVIAMDAAQLPRALADVDLAVINTVFASSAGLKPKSDGLFCERADAPYANLVVVRTANKDQAWVAKLLKAVQHPKVKMAAEKIFAGSALASWEQ